MDDKECQYCQEWEDALFKAQKVSEQRRRRVAELQRQSDELKTALTNLEAWVNGYAQDYVPNGEFHQTGGFDCMEAARSILHLLKDKP